MSEHADANQRPSQPPDGVPGDAAPNHAGSKEAVPQSLGAPDHALLMAAGYGARPATTAPDWLPWRRVEESIIVATTLPITNGLHGRIETELAAALGQPTKVDFVRAEPTELLSAIADLREAMRAAATDRFSSEHPKFSAKDGLRVWQSAVPACILVFVIIGLVWDWRAALIVLFAVGNITFFANSVFKIGASLARPVRRLRERRLTNAERRYREATLPAEPTAEELDAAQAIEAAALRAAAADDELPVYTILVPVYREANVIASILANFERLDYPHEKLDVLVLLEEDDTETIAAAQAADPPPWVRCVIVPDGEPRTKPRACNYGLLLARGSYVVIYDAEDRPEPDQLRKALISFRHDAVVHRRRGEAAPLACVQAALNFYNPDYNVLTRMFAVEYAQWFDLMLPGLDAMRTPMPLGGTSNHFLKSALVEVGGWDPYNVTEDADLGLRLTASGYRVDVVSSTTWEEATTSVSAWIRQRTRWIKGYLVTAAVNLRRPLRWLRHNSGRAALTMGGLIFGTPACFLLYPLTIGFTAFAWLTGPLLSIRLPEPLLILGVTNMLIMNIFMILTSAYAGWLRYNWRVGIFAVFLPVYWLLHAWAAWRAMLQLAWAPHTWEKTPHGMTEEYDDSLVDNRGLAHTARG